jgi:hypothetical protein
MAMEQLLHPAGIETTAIQNIAAEYSVHVHQLMYCTCRYGAYCGYGQVATATSGTREAAAAALDTDAGRQG